MEPVIRRLRVETYKEQLAVCEEIRDALSRNFNNPALTDDERITIGNRCNAAQNESYALQIKLDLIECEIREERQGAATH
jgi:tRNA 2-selenouridine synthase SelU